MLFLILALACKGDDTDAIDDTETDGAAETDVDTDTGSETDIPEDTDPNERDDDGDGVSENQGDCDDADPYRTPGRPDPLDGADADCDEHGDIQWNGHESAGAAVAAGDLDGDGAIDAIVGAPLLDVDGRDEVGTAYVAFGPLSTGSNDLADVSTPIVGAHRYVTDDQAWIGNSLAAVDQTGDGIDDLVIGGRQLVYVLAGPLGPSDRELPLDSYARLVPEDNQLASGLATGDLDSDGFGDVIIGAYGDANGHTYAGTVYIQPGPFSGEVDLGDAPTVLTGEGDWDIAGVAIAVVGDTDGDGIPEILVGAPSNQGTPGRAYVVSGSTVGVASLADADAVLMSDVDFGYAGSAVAGGDVNADGYADLLVGTPSDSTIAELAGSASLVYGPVSGSVAMSDADARFSTGLRGDLCGTSLVVADVDGSGSADVAVGAPGADGHSGRVYVAIDPGAGDIDLTTSPIHAEGLGEAGTRLAPAGDVDGDGRLDFMIGVTANQTQGTAWLWFTPN